MLKKLTKILYISIALTVIFAGRAFAYEFVADTKGVKCLDDEGNYVKGWVSKNNYIFWFDAFGYMATGKKTLEGTEYIFNYGADYAPIGALISDKLVFEEKYDSSIRYVVGRNTKFDNGQIIVLIHGLTGSIEDSLTLAEHYVAYGFKVIVPELVAHGISTEIASVPQIIARSTIGIEDIIKKNISESTPSVNIIGTSLGGMIGACIARNLKAIVSKLVLLISTYDFSALDDDMFFKTYYQGRPVEMLEKTSIKQLFRGMNPNNDPNLFSYTKVYLVQSATDDVIPYLPNPKASIDAHLTSAVGHNLKDVDYFDSFDFLLDGAKKYIQTDEEKAIFNMVSIEDAYGLSSQHSSVLASTTLGIPPALAQNETEAIAAQTLRDNSNMEESTSAAKGPGLKENGEALTQEEIEEIQESMEASGEFVMARAISGN